jgi:hypothetical protein
MHPHRGVAILGMQHDAIQMKNAILRNSPVVPVLTIHRRVAILGMQHRELTILSHYKKWYQQ